MKTEDPLRLLKSFAYSKNGKVSPIDEENKDHDQKKLKRFITNKDQDYQRHKSFKFDTSMLNERNMEEYFEDHLKIQNKDLEQHDHSNESHSDSGDPHEKCKAKAAAKTFA